MSGIGKKPPAWFQPRLPTSEECSLGRQLLKRASADPRGALVFFESGEVWSNADAARDTLALAARLRALGVGRDDIVAVWQPNGRNILRALFACSLLGATASLLNIALKGNLLTHALRLTAPKLLYGHGELIARCESEDLAAVGALLSSEPVQLQRRDVTLYLEDSVAVEDAQFGAETIHPWDVPVIVFTSGTTGPSKGVRVTAAQLWTLGGAYYGFMRADDRILLMLPLFHIASLGALYGAISAGASMTVVEAFRPAEFWSVVRRSGATTNVGLNGAWMNMIAKATPVGAADRDHKFRIALITSPDPIARDFAERFGCDLFAAYGMSEASGIAISEINTPKNRTVGKLREGIEGRLVDEHDIEVPPGEPGELIIRAGHPWVLNDGYHNNPEATAQAWRNGWFHTGDVFTQDGDGDLYYVDRNKDVIRRRGENISSLELEAEIRGFAAVRDVAAVGVKDDAAGEEVLAIIEPLDAAAFDPAALTEFLIARVPHFMVPRYVRVVASLPRTATNKVQKVELRREGLTPDCWDREAAGLKVRRQKLST
ncbi:MAG: AMP-binding protein [Hyphomonadaceae bacterium]|nr:AMP-binding protein [Hyphomonadaceae bacterium]